MQKRAKIRGEQPIMTKPVWAYGLISSIGDITRFAQSKKLVAYFGLNPSICQSGNYEGATALKRHGRGAMRALGAIGQETPPGRKPAAEVGSGPGRGADATKQP